MKFAGNVTTFSVGFCRRGSSRWRKSTGALSGGRVAVGHHHNRLPDAPPGDVDGGHVRTRQEQA